MSRWIEHYETTEMIAGFDSEEHYYSSTLWYGRSRQTELEVVIKIIRFNELLDLKQLRVQRQLQNQFREEKRTLDLLSGTAGVVQCLDYYERDDEMVIVLNKVDGISLSDYIHAEGSLSFIEARTIGMRIAEALAKVHQKGIIHRDLTPNNILLNAHLQPTIIDFGLAFRGRGVMIRGAGTSGYMPPEAFQLKEKHQPSYDIFSFGIVLFYMLEGKLPYLQEEINLEMGALPFSKAHTPAVMKDLITLCLQKDARKRPTAAYVTRKLMGMEGTM